MCPEVEKEMEKLGEVTKFCNLCRLSDQQEKEQIALGGGRSGGQIAKCEKSILNY